MTHKTRDEQSKTAREEMTKLLPKHTAYWPLKDRTSPRTSEAAEQGQEGQTLVKSRVLNSTEHGRRCHLRQRFGYGEDVHLTAMRKLLNQKGYKVDASFNKN